MEILKGILLSKTSFQDRHIIGRLLLTSGECLSVTFYGGKGGGKRQKPSILELGNCLEVKLKSKGRQSSSLVTAESWKSVWFYEALRTNYEAYYLLCFYVELCQKLSTDADVENFKKYGLEKDNGLFNVLSNALFYLEEALKKQKFHKSEHLSLFLIKILFTQGVAPEITACLFCEELFNVSAAVYLQNEGGGFVCSACASSDQKNFGASDLELLQVVKKIWPLKYAEFEQVGKVEHATLQGLYRYFCYQFQFEPYEFKTSSYIL
jgi:recombinational DNA repair protein (RecF pathway)